MIIYLIYSQQFSSLQKKEFRGNGKCNHAFEEQESSTCSKSSALQPEIL